LAPALVVGAAEGSQTAGLVLIVPEGKHRVGLRRLDHLLDRGGTTELARAEPPVAEPAAWVTRSVAGRDDRHVLASDRGRGGARCSDRCGRLQTDERAGCGERDRRGLARSG